MARARWLLDNLLNFTPHALVLAVVLLGAGLAVRSTPAVVLGLGGVACGAWLAGRAGQVVARTGPPPAAAAHTVRVATVNFEHSNDQYERLLALVWGRRPDILVLQEWTGAPSPLLAALCEVYPHHLRGRWPDPELYSRWPLEEVAVHRLPGPDSVSAVLEARIEAAGQPLHLLGLHAEQPGALERAVARRAQFDLVERLVADGRPVVVVGDLNATVCSMDLQRLLRRSGLRSVAGRGRHALGQATWPASAGPLGVRIDHVLVRGLAPVRVEVGPDVGSDHRPLIADLIIGGK